MPESFSNYYALVRFYLILSNDSSICLPCEKRIATSLFKHQNSHKSFQASVTLSSICHGPMVEQNKSDEWHNGLAVGIIFQRSTWWTRLIVDDFFGDTKLSFLPEWVLRLCSHLFLFLIKSSWFLTEWMSMWERKKREWWWLGCILSLTFSVLGVDQLWVGNM